MMMRDAYKQRVGYEEEQNRRRGARCDPVYYDSPASHWPLRRIVKRTTGDSLI
jgi:hypothetical protein